MTNSPDADATLPPKQTSGDEPSARIAFSPDGKVILTATDDHVQTWDPATGKELSLLKIAGTKSTLKLSPDGRVLFTGGGLFDFDTGARRATLALGGFQAHRFDPQGPRLALSVATSLSGGEVRLWALDQGASQEVFTLRGHDGPVTNLAYSSDGRRIASCSGLDNSIRIWDAGPAEAH